MSESHFCACPCHTDKQKEHTGPCCDGPCHRCKKFIRTGMMGQHVREKHPETNPPSRMSGSFKRPKGLKPT